MGIPANIVGTKLEDATLRIDTRATLAFAAGIRADRARYLDDLQADGIMAPPSFCAVPEWAVLNSQAFRETLQIDVTRAQGGVHVVQDTIFHAPLRPPDLIHVTGTILQVRQTSIGTLVAASVKTRSQIGVLLTETFWSSIYVGVNCEADGASEAAPNFEEQQPRPGVCERLSLSIPRWLPHSYTECSGIWNPIHTERSAALRNGLPDIILHGTAIWALIGEVLIDKIGHGDPSSLHRLSCRFKRAVIPGDAVALNVSSDIVATTPKCRFVLTNCQDETAVTEGLAEFSGPGF